MKETYSKEEVMLMLANIASHEGMQANYHFNLMKEETQSFDLDSLKACPYSKGHLETAIKLEEEQ